MPNYYLKEDDSGDRYQLQGSSDLYLLESQQESGAPSPGGSGVIGPQIEIVQQAARTSTGTQDFTVPGAGTCKGAMFFGPGAITNGTAATNVQFSIGACDGTNQYAHGVVSITALGTSQTDRRGTTDECIQLLSADGSIGAEANFDSFITDGVRVNWGVAGGAKLITAWLFFDDGSDLSFAVGTATGAGPDTTVTSITAPGFEPDIVLASDRWGLLNDTVSGNAFISFGLACNGAAISQSCHSMFSDDNEGTSAVAGIVRDNRIANEVHDGVTGQSLELSAFTANGFDVKLHNEGAESNITFGYVAIAFNGKKKVWSTVLDSPTTTGDWAVATPHMRPEFVGMATGDIVAVNTFYDGGAPGFFGISSFTATDENSVTIADEDNQDTTDTQSLVDARAVVTTADSGTLTYQSSNSKPPVLKDHCWTVTMDTVPATARKWPAFAIGTPIDTGAYVGIVQERTGTSTGTQDYVVPGGGVCKGAMFFVARTTLSGSPLPIAALGIGACDHNGNQYAHSTNSADNAGTSATDRRGATNECIMLVTTAGTVDGEANFDSVITDGIRVNWGNAPLQSYRITAWLFFDSPGGGDLQFAVGTEDATSGEGNVTSVEGPGFLPDVVLASTSRQSAGFIDAASTNAAMWLGFACRSDPIKQACHSFYSNNAEDTSNISGRVEDYRLLVNINQANTRHGLELTAFDSLGFDVTARDNATSGSFTFGYVAIGFSGRNDYWCGVLDSPTSTGDWAVTSPGIKPQFVAMATGYIPAVNTFYGGSGDQPEAGAFGISSFNPTAQNSVTISDEDNEDITDTQSLVDSKAIVVADDGGVLVLESSATSHPTMDANGFTINLPTTVDGTARKWPTLVLGAGMDILDMDPEFSPSPPPGTGVKWDNPIGPGIGMRPG